MLGVLGRAGIPLAPEWCLELGRLSPLLPVLRGGNLGRAQDAAASPCQDRGSHLGAPGQHPTLRAPALALVLRGRVERGQPWGPQTGCRAR